MIQKDSQRGERVGISGFVFKILVCVAISTLPNIIVMFFDMGNEKLGWKGVVGTG